MSTNFYHLSFDFLNNIYMLGAHLIYVTLCSSNILMLVKHLFTLHDLQKNKFMLL